MSKMMVKITVLLVCCFLLVLDAGATSVKTQGVGEVFYTGWGEPSAKVKREAHEKAKISAFKKYIRTFDDIKTETYQKIKSDIESNLDRYISDCKTIDDYTDKEAKIYRVVVEATIDTSSIEIELKKNSAVQKIESQKRSRFVFIFVKRKVVYSKSFAAKVTAISNNETAEDEEKDTKILRGGGSSHHGYQEKTKIQKGGNVEQKADIIEYEVSRSKDFDKIMKKTIANAGYKVVRANRVKDTEGNKLKVKIKQIINDFKSGAINDDTLDDAIDICCNRKGGAIDFLATGTVDVGTKEIDPSTGNVRVYVSVAGEVLDLRDDDSETIASVGPIQYSGLGPNQQIASRNALQTAGKEAAGSLIAQLRAKGIK